MYRVIVQNLDNNNIIGNNMLDVVTDTFVVGALDNEGVGNTAIAGDSYGMACLIIDLTKMHLEEANILSDDNEN